MKRIRPYIIFILCWLILLTIAGFFAPPPLITDSGYGFLAMYNFQHGGSFNTIVTPAINDISKTCAPYFLSIWSPGQWVVPWLFLSLPIKLNTAMVLTVGLFSALGITGYYRLYKLLGFADMVCILSVTLICAARYFVLNFQVYHGGEVLQFGGLPWLLIVCYKKRKNYLDFLLIILSMVVAYFLKSSAILMIVLFALVYEYYTQGKSSAVGWFEAKKINKLIILSAALLVGWTLCSTLFIRNGVTPLTMQTKSATDFTSSAKSFFFIIAGPLSATIGIDTYVGHFVQGQVWALLFYMLLSVAFISLCVYYFKTKGFYYSRQPILIICLGYIIFFLLNYFPFRHISANTDARHFRPAALLLVPLIIEFLFEKINRRKVHRALLILIFILSGYAVMSYAKRFNEPLTISKTWGFGHVNINDAVLSFIETHKNAGITWYFISPEIALEVPNGSAMVFHDNSNDIATIRKRSIKGRANKLCIILPDNFRDNGAMVAIVGSFKDYNKSDFQYHELSGYTIISNGILIN